MSPEQQELLVENIMSLTTQAAPNKRAVAKLEAKRQQQINRINTYYNEKISHLESGRRSLVDPVFDAIERHWRVLFAAATALRFPSAVIKLTSGSSIQIEGGMEATAVATLETLGEDDYVKVEKTITNKRKLVQNPDLVAQLPGVSIQRTKTARIAYMPSPLTANSDLTDERKFTLSEEVSD